MVEINKQPERLSGVWRWRNVVTSEHDMDGILADD